MKKKIKKRKTKKINIKLIITCMISFLCVLLLSYCLFCTDILNPTVDELTSSYISFNNISNSDSIKIKGLKKMSDKRGKSFINYSYADFNIYMDNNNRYQIVLADFNDFDRKYVKFLLKINDKEVLCDYLNNMNTLSNGNIVLYEGENGNKDRVVIKMWIDKNYKGNPSDISYGVYLKSR